MAQNRKASPASPAAPLTPRVGRVYLVGAGPGDPDLVTRRAELLLRSCDAVVYDQLVNPEILDWCPIGAERHDVGKQPGRHTLPQAEIESLLVGLARKGLRVVRLKGGDPFVFGRAGEEARSLAEAGIPFEIVPGVTAALAAAASAGIPLTHREAASAVMFLTGHEDPEKHVFSVDFAAVARVPATLVVYMGVGQVARITAELAAGGRPDDEPAAAVQWASCPRQRVVRATLGTLAARMKEEGIGTPAILCFGPAVALGEPWAPLLAKPLAGRRVVVTRSREQSGELTAALREAGADVIELPLLRIVGVDEPGSHREVWGELAAYEWIVFTSTNGVKHFFEAFRARHADARELGGARIAAVGAATARAVAEEHFAVDVVPEEANAEALGRAIAEHASLDNLRMLVVTGNRNRDTLVKALEEARAIVDQLPVYRNERVDVATLPAAERFRAEGADAVVFASSSAVEAFVGQAKALQRAEGARVPRCASLGPKTSAALREAGLPVDIEAAEPSVEAMVEALAKALGPAGA